MGTEDLLTLALDRARRELKANGPTKTRIHSLWAAAKAARELAASDVLQAQFVGLAIESKLIDEHGHWTGADVRPSVRRFGKEDVDHTINCALRGMNPFETGPLR